MGTVVHGIEAADLRVAVDAMREGLQIIDREWRYVYINDAAAAHGRRAPEELIGRTMMECFPGIDGTDLFAVLRACMTDGVNASIENRFTYDDGSTRTFELRIQRSAVGISVLSIDVTEARRVEIELRQAQKMEAIGRLAGGVAHDFNNLLSIILSYTSMARDELAPDSPLRADLAEVSRAGERAADLTRQLLAFSRHQPVVPQVVNLNHIVLGLEKMLRRLMSADVALSVITGAPLGEVYADPGQLEQVVLNLVVNARDAIRDGGGGAVTIETANGNLNASFASEHLGITPGPHVVLTVVDTGIGMDAATREQIFEPFFTTKSKGNGTGLGLAMAFGIVKRAGGYIGVHSELGRGTTFRVYLPCTDRLADAPTPTLTLTSPTTLRGTETILVVEDNPQLLAILRTVLRSHGYNVLAAPDGVEALRICDGYKAEIHLVITDVVMPRMGGRELVERVTKIRPGLRVIHTSGYSERAVVQRGDSGSDGTFLQKPLTPDVVLRTVRVLLDTPGRHRG
jgi:signal transduction histidine kinase/CheY-like chemotaxis protein